MSVFSFVLNILTDILGPTEFIQIAVNTWSGEFIVRQLSRPSTTAILKWHITQLTNEHSKMITQCCIRSVEVTHVQHNSIILWLCFIRGGGGREWERDTFFRNYYRGPDSVLYSFEYVTPTLLYFILGIRSAVRIRFKRGQK